MDEAHFEHAAMLEQIAREKGIALARLRELRSHLPPPDFDGACTCGAEIPQPRLDRGYFACVACVQEREKRAKLGLP